MRHQGVVAQDLGLAMHVICNGATQVTADGSEEAYPAESCALLAQMPHFDPDETYWIRNGDGVVHQVLDTVHMISEPLRRACVVVFFSASSDVMQMKCDFDGNLLGGDGASASSPGLNCRSLLDFHDVQVSLPPIVLFVCSADLLQNQESGKYWIAPKGIAAFQVYCGEDCMMVLQLACLAHYMQIWRRLVVDGHTSPSLVSTPPRLRLTPYTPVPFPSCYHVIVSTIWYRSDLCARDSQTKERMLPSSRTTLHFRFQSPPR